MNVITLPKSDYKKILQEQEDLRAQLLELGATVRKIASEEISPTAHRRLERRSKRIDKGEGIRFSSIAQMKKYMKEL